MGLLSDPFITLHCNIPESAYPSAYPRVQHTLAFIRYCHSQYCKIHIAIQGGSGGNNIVRNRVGDEGGGGCPNRGMFAQHIIDSCTQTVEQKNIL